MNDRFYRSRDERVIAGVAGGVAERYDLDPSLVRVGWVLLVFLSGGLFFLLYLVMAVVVPEAPDGADRWPARSDPSGTEAVPGWTPPGAPISPTWGAPSPGVPGAAPTGGPAATSTDTPVDETDPSAAAFAGTQPSAAAPPPPPPVRLPPRPEPGPSGRRGHGRRRDRSGAGGVVVGILFILVGAYYLLRTYLPDVHLEAFWPVVLVVIGLALVAGAIRPGPRGEAR